MPSSPEMLTPLDRVSDILLLFWLVEFDQDSLTVIYDLGMDLQPIVFGRAMCSDPKRLRLTVEVNPFEELVNLAVHPLLPRINRGSALPALKALYDLAHRVFLPTSR